ncbi:hypothetical protein ACWF7H_09055 [Peribacillus butanolivorans]
MKISKRFVKNKSWFRRLCFLLPSVIVHLALYNLLDGMNKIMKTIGLKKTGDEKKAKGDKEL